MNLSLFRELRRARGNLESLHVRVSEGIIEALGLLLAESPDPDQALNLFERFLAAHGKQAELLDQNRVLLHYAIVLFGHSYWLGESVVRNPDVLDELKDVKSLERCFGREEYGQRLNQFCRHVAAIDTSLLLARFKKREYVHIALRDLLGIATLAETIDEISALADVIVEQALREAESMAEDSSHVSPPGAFTVLALGKLGGNELNYSSDLDLLYLYDGSKASSSLSADEYFIHQAQRLTNVLSSPTVEGAVCRVDLRLRPQGQEGEPAVSLQRALDYYLRDARDWEFQALIKARHVAGDAQLAQTFLRGIERQIYTEHLNFTAIETAVRARQKIDDRSRRVAFSRQDAAAPDVKLDHGGIRDIEFLVQCLQRVYGGSEPWLRSSGTLFSLQKLHDKDHIAASDFQQLSRAYEFLRRVEHRLQLQRGRQVHRLPDPGVESEILWRALGTRDAAESGSVLSAVESCMASVKEIYRRVILSERGKEGQVLVPAAPFSREGRGSFEHTLKRITGYSPELAQRLRGINLSRHTQRALDRFLNAASTSAENHLLLLDDSQMKDAQTVDRLLAVLENSEFLTEILVRHPEAAGIFRDLPAAIEPSSREPQKSSFVDANSARDLGEVMAALRSEFRGQILGSGTRDILKARPALDSMKETTLAAERSIQAALRAVGGEEILAVFALGRLGTREFDIASDADLLFIRHPGTQEPHARAVAERLVHALAAYTRDGTVFAVDARLRPHGGAGELVVTPAQLEKYLAGEAQAWETLTYSKIRFLAGPQPLVQEVLRQVRNRIVKTARATGFTNDVLEMRARLERSNRFPHSFKLACGGFYDIDFIASFLMLRHTALDHGNTLERLEHLRKNGLLHEPLSEVLVQATVLYRTVDHVIRLVTGRARPELPEAEHARQVTETLAGRILGRELKGKLQAEIEATQRQIRPLFLRLIVD